MNIEDAKKLKTGDVVLARLIVCKDGIDYENDVCCRTRSSEPYRIYVDPELIISVEKPALKLDDIVCHSSNKETKMKIIYIEKNSAICLVLDSHPILKSYTALLENLELAD